MRPRTGPSPAGRAVRLGLALMIAPPLFAWLAVVGADEPPKTEAGAGAAAPIPTARGAVEPAAPVLPAEIVGLMQEGRFDEADKALTTHEATLKDPDERVYDQLVRAVAVRLAGRTDAARDLLRKALEARPQGAWAAKVRGELASLELATGHPDRAEALARAQAEGLLAGPRKDRLAAVYRDFARRLLEPADPVTPPDPKGAYDLLAQARTLARGKTLRARLLFEMAEALRKAGDHGRALADLQAYLAEYADGADRSEVRYLLGDSQRASGQAPAARLTWTDLARDLAAHPEPAGDVRARAMHGIALTHGIPAPPDDTSLNLGVAALRRFLEAYPAHRLAPLAAYQIGESNLARGKSDAALAAFNAFLKAAPAEGEPEEARRERARLAMSATFLTGKVLQGQQKFDEAVAAYRGYLAKFPDGPQSADAQRAILDTQLAAAAEHRARERYEEARAAWQAFATANPLDGRVPQLLYQIGESLVAEKAFDRALAAWEPLLGRFPASEPAAHALFDGAAVLESEKGDLEAAIARFKRVKVDPWTAQAAQRIAVMESRELTVVTPRAFRSGEVPHLKVTTRNLERLTFSAYRLNPESYFRKKHDLAGVEALDIGLVAPDAEWSQVVPGYARLKPVESTYELKHAAVKVPGVYVVKVTDEKHLQATTLLVGSDVDAIVKTSREQLLVFAQDMKTGKGRAGARVLVAEGGEVVLDAKVGPDGVLLKDWEKPRAPNAALHYLVVDGENVAGSGLGVPGKVSRGLSPRAYVDTDRPAYRPGQTVALRGVVREVRDGQYDAPAGAVYRLEVTDSRGRQIVARNVALSKFGSFHDTLPLDSGAPLGTYRVRVHQPGKSDFSGAFEVQAYRLEPLDLTITLESPVVLRGEPVEADVTARYQYGAPAAGRPIQVRLPDGRTLTGSTDAAGTYHVTFPTEGYAEEQTLTLVAQLPQDNVAAAARVAVAVRAFSVSVSTPRDVYLDGESFPVAVTTVDARGEPTGQSLSVALIKRVTQAGRVTEREVGRKPLSTDPKTGGGSVTLEAADAEGGPFVVRVAGTDRSGNPIVADRPLTISGAKDQTRLRLLADRQTYKVGEEAKVNLHSRGAGGPALVTWEADRILSYRVVNLAEGNNPVAWPVEGPQFPNFSLAAARMAGTRFDEARLDYQVERDLKVEVKPSKTVFGPGEEVRVDVTTTDQLGRPVAAELSLALVDRALLRLHADRLPAIGAFFHGQTRTGAFTAVSTNTFRYAPATAPVADAVVEEAERAAAAAGNQMGRGMAIEDARRQVQLAEKASPPMMRGGMGIPAPAAPPPPGEMAGQPGQTQAGQAVISADSDGEEADKPQDASIAFRSGTRARKAGEANQEYGSMLQMQDAKRSDAFGYFSDGASLGKAKGNAVAPTRERFVETAYWNPAVVTGPDGKTTVTFKAPAAFSTYRLAARGVTGSDTLVGQAEAELSVRKDFFVDLKTPARLTQGDKPRFAARVHHVGVPAGTATLRLTVYAGGREQVFPKDLPIKGDGVDEVLFEPFEVPDGDVVRLTLAGSAGAAKDQLVVEVPIRPWGVQSFASASGTTTADATVFVALPPGRAYEAPEMLVVVSPSLARLLVELAVGREAFPLSELIRSNCLPPPTVTTTDRAGDLLAAASVLGYLRAAGGAAAAPEAGRLTDRVRGLVTELTASQNEDGGWPWIAGGGLSKGQDPGQARPSDRTTSARVVWALASVEPLGLLTDPKALEKAAAHLTQEYAKLAPGDHDTRAAILHALASRGKATFEQANSLNRFRQGLSDAALAYLALTFAALERPSLAGEALDVLGPRGKAEAVGPGEPPRTSWGGSGGTSWARDPAEATALVALAYARARPAAAELERATRWLLAHRAGVGWQPYRAKGPALAALSAYHAKAAAADDRYELVVTVNETEVHRARIEGAAQGKALTVPRDALKPAAPNRVRFHLEGRGTLGFAVTLTGFTRDLGPDQTQQGRPFLVTRHAILPAEPELDGRRLPVGFGVAVNAPHFENLAHQVDHGGRVRVQVNAHRISPAGQPVWERDFLVLEDHIPAGTTLVDGSVQSAASHHEVDGDTIRFYFAPDQEPYGTTYDLFGYLPGHYRTLPPILSSAYEPGRRHMASAGTFDLEVLAPGAPRTDPYKPTPDELYARGKALFDAGKTAQAAPLLEQLHSGYTLRDDVAKDGARMLLMAFVKDYDARKVVQYFELVKEKAPELVITFDDLLTIGRAYRDINEFERAYLVWRGLADASYLEDGRIGEVLRQRGKALEGAAYLAGLWREYPDSAAIEADFFALSQLVARHAVAAETEPALRRSAAEAGVTRNALLLQSIRMTQAFLVRAPNNPLADEASLALVNDFLELDDFDSVVKLAARFAKLYPKSRFLDSFQYSEALGEFNLGHHDRAVEVAKAIAAAVYKDAAGADQPSPNKWEAVYILGQIHDARRQPAEALTYYKQVADRFTDAAEAVRWLTRKTLTLPEVTVVRPPAPAPAPAPAAGAPAPAPAPAAPKPPDDAPGPRFPDRLRLSYRNLPEADVKVYPVDLMRLYLTRRNLDAIAGIDLAGITPLVERPLPLGGVADGLERRKDLDLGLTKEGAYLVMARGENLYASGIVLVTPLELEVLEEPEAGRVRVTVRDAATGAPVPKVQVKVIGSENPTFLSGETDLRGVYLAEGVRGQAAAVARHDAARYAFYRGQTRLGPAQEARPSRNAPAQQGQSQPSLSDNIKNLNTSNQLKQIERLQQRYEVPAPSAPAGAAAGGFR